MNNVSVLRLPQPQAEEQLAHRIKTGYELAAFDPSDVPGTENHEVWLRQMAAFEHRIEGWRAFNRTWLEKYLGGAASDEYNRASTHPYYITVDVDLADKARILQDWVTDEAANL